MDGLKLEAQIFRDNDLFIALFIAILFWFDYDLVVEILLLGAASIYYDYFGFPMEPLFGINFRFLLL